MMIVSVPRGHGGVWEENMRTLIQLSIFKSDPFLLLCVVYCVHISILMLYTMYKETKCWHAHLIFYRWGV